MFKSIMLSLENTDTDTLPRLVVHELSRLGLTVATAESCTGGYIAKRITDVSGSSAVLEGSIVTYSPRIKEQFVFVKPDTIEKFGVVSAQTAEEMAVGIKRAIGADIGISVTGVAGPDGDTEKTPVGLVWLGCATEDGVMSEKLLITPQTDNPREEIRYMTTNYALKKILDVINEKYR